MKDVRIKAQALEVISSIVKREGSCPTGPNAIRKLGNVAPKATKQCAFAQLQSNKTKIAERYGVKRVYDEDGKDWWVSLSDPRPAEYRNKHAKRGWKGKRAKNSTNQKSVKTGSINEKFVDKDYRI